ncbi:hypothetical protein KO506_00485 [Polaribacter vadi]|uniref:hypothetical protein n=1 Tax=Polaribacter TaxID=52959 RepID=UPI001C0974CD|nr:MULTISPECIES: hypothetical protein [Polaribacter]MBU3009876.1 hypothetical protein [Polaribacter vadi]MDO6739682.1 hypothetical protein [Polaribacter sp. 1_MG-2023]
MKINKFLNIKSLAILALSLVVLVACNDDEDFGTDADKIVAKIFDFSGPTLVSLDEVDEFSVTPRAGSTFVWEVTGAEMQVIEGATHKINVNYNQIGVATVSVYEVAANGSTSEVSSQNVDVLQLCSWSVEMNDTWGDSWNGAELQITFDGAVDLAPVVMALTEADAGYKLESFSAPVGYDMTVTFVSGDYDEEISYSIFDASGNTVYSVGDFTYSIIPPAGVVYTTTVVCP